MPNVKSIVNGHNRKILAEITDEEARTCNCPRNTPCPMNKNCLSENTLYSATVRSTLPNFAPKKYIGLSAPPWKQRFYNHNKEFNDRNSVQCQLAKEVWKIKDQGGDYDVKWEIIGHAPAYNPISKKCQLCTAEKLLIAEDPDPHILNKRDELISKCRHRRKFSLEL